MLHCADISNPCKEWPLSKKWSDLIVEEFFRQGDLEKQQNLPISAHGDRDKTDRAQFGLNFIDFVVAPLFVSLRNLLPAANYCCENLRNNRKQWETILVRSIRCSTKSETEKQAELARWNRRHASFYDIILPPGRIRRGSSLATLEEMLAQGAAAAGDFHPEAAEALLPTSSA